MTKQIKAITIASVATIVLLSSCSNKFGSKEEARLAQLEFLEGAREFAVVDVPTDAEVEEKIYNAKVWRKVTCRTAKEHLRTGKDPSGKPIDPYYLRRTRVSVQKDCYPGAPLGVSKESLTKRDTKRTRICNYEEETRSYVCKEWKVKGDEIMKDKWLDLKPTYTYFRF